MPDKRIRVAVWAYRNAKGKNRLAYFGDVVDLPDAEIERGEQAGVFDQPAPEPTTPVVVDEDDDVSVPADDTGSGDDQPPVDSSDLSSGPKGPVPPKAGLKELWVEYAVANGMSEAEAEALSKQELIARFGGSGE